MKIAYIYLIDNNIFFFNVQYLIFHPESSYIKQICYYYYSDNNNYKKFKL